MFGPMMNKALTRKFIRNNINHEWKANNSKSREKLGVTYRPLKETMQDTFQALVDSGTFKK
jgi:dihydroflavonol-4-reductase